MFNYYFKRIRTILRVCLLFVVSCKPSTAQYPKSAACKDKAFDQKVDQTIAYTIPVIDVMNAYKNRDMYVFVDAREWEEYKTSHISNAVHIGYDEWNPSVLNKIDKQKPIIVYCSIGYRSEKIAEKIKASGFAKVYNLYGSIFEWANNELPLVEMNNKPTQKVHTYNKKWSKWMLNPKYEKIW